MTGAEAESAFYKMGNRAVSLRVGGPGLGANPSPTSSAESENVCIYISTAPPPPKRVFLKYFSIKYSRKVHGYLLLFPASYCGT